MKGVFPSPEPKALVGTKQDPWSVSLFPFFFFFIFCFLEDGAVPGVARSVSVVTVHPEKKTRFCVALFFLNSPPCL